MTRRIRRHADFEIVLEVKNDEFINTPADRQRNWTLNRAIKEMGDELVAMDQVASGFIPGGQPMEIADRGEISLSEQDIMEDWQKPIMEAMAALVSQPGKDVLEIGFGRGVASDMIQVHQPASHTIVECNPHIIDDFENWKQSYAGRDIRMLPGMWQDVTDQMGLYDGIFFHTYPLNDQEYLEQVTQSVTFAEHFFTTASAHLKPGGGFAYLTNEADSLSRAHQRLLLDHFSSFSMSLVKDLGIPPDSRDSHWRQQMVVVRAQK